MTKHYELTYAVPKNITPEESVKLLEKISSHLPQVTISEKGNIFFSLNFYSEPGAIRDLEKKLESEPQIEKYLIVKMVVEKIAKTRRMPVKTSVEEQKVEKAELKEIDEKLKEIFGE